MTKNQRFNHKRINRPININPFSIKLPLSALTSIAHRLSGLCLFLMIPLILWALQTLIESPKGYEQLAEALSSKTCKMSIGLFFSAMGYHMLAGFRHILMDIQWLPESLKAAKISAWVVWAATILLIICLGFRLFGGMS